MQRYKLAGCAGLLLMAAVSTGRGGTAGNLPAAADARIQNLLSQLADVDPLVRTDSQQRLINLGEAARPAMRQALSAATPQVRCELNFALLHIPWIRAGDGDAVEQAFAGYAELDAESRCARIDGWLAPLHDSASPALLRVVLTDPSAAVRWDAADALRMNLDDNALISREVIDLATGTANDSASYLPANENAPLLAVAGWSCRSTQPRRAADLLEQAVRVELSHPSAFRGQMEFVFLWLIDRANALHDQARVVELLREQAARSPWVADRVPDPVTNLFAAQTEFGPFPGYGDDLRTYREYLTHPELVYCMAKLAQRQGQTRWAQALSATALLMSGDSFDLHYQAGLFLSSHSWDGPAETELKWALKLSGGTAVNVYFQLSAVADDRDDDLASAQYMEAGLQKLVDSRGLTQTDRYGQVHMWSSDDAWAEVHWHYMRAARDAHDAVAEKMHLDKLLSMDQAIHILDRDPGLAADIVPALQQQNRPDLAKTIFDAAYVNLKQKMDAAPDESMPRNNLAWLCASSGLHLDDAMKWAAQSVAADPQNSAYLDTQAEALLQTGQVRKAVEIETHALSLKPEDVYMKKQLARFKVAAKQP